MRRYLQSVLAQDYQVLQARDGQDGLDKTLECQPDLVLLDLMLPKIDGLEVCRILKQQKKASRIKIMLLTARVNEQAKITALNHGADDFLTKPFSSLEVRTRLKNLLATAQLERDLADRNKELENTLSELQVTQGQLIQSEKINALGSLAAGLLHEINNPLNYTLTALQLVRADPSVKSNELLQEVVGDIDEGMQRIRAIVSDLRAFAYPSEADKQQIFDISQAVESALRFVASETKGIDIVVDLPSDESATVVGSQSHIVHVLVNLLSNAAKAVGDDDKAGGEIRIRGRREQGRLQLEVSDNGVGIPEENLSKIFDPFFTTRDVGEGMGLGLSICHTIVTNHGGALRADSRLGSGTRMFFDLPISGDQP